MFRWYRNATRCYVYLSDVPTTSFTSNRTKKSTKPWESDFRKSRWFTRGWTLQELLAPTSVEFFSQEGKRLGDKSSLGQEIHEITNISYSALQGDPLSQFSVEERLRWIEHRQTKLEEDKAYTLLGIFDVYILPIYGEGIASALARLLDEFYMVQNVSKTYASLIPVMTRNVLRIPRVACSERRGRDGRRWSMGVSAGISPESACSPCGRDSCGDV